MVGLLRFEYTQKEQEMRTLKKQLQEQREREYLAASQLSHDSEQAPPYPKEDAEELGNSIDDSERKSGSSAEDIQSTKAPPLQHGKIFSLQHLMCPQTCARY